MPYLLEPAQVQLDVRSLSLQRHHVSFEAPAQVGVEVGGGVGAALSLVAGQVGCDGQAQHRIIDVQQGREGGGVHPSTSHRPTAGRQVHRKGVARQRANIQPSPADCADLPKVGCPLMPMSG